MLDQVLWYNEPAKSWEEAIPIGNGAIGGMIFGGVNKEHIQMNEESLGMVAIEIGIIQMQQNFYLS